MLAGAVMLSLDLLSEMMTTAPGTLDLRPAEDVRRNCLVNVSAWPAEGDRALSTDFNYHLAKTKKW